LTICVRSIIEESGEGGGEDGEYEVVDVVGRGEDGWVVFRDIDCRGTSRLFAEVDDGREDF